MRRIAAVYGYDQTYLQLHPLIWAAALVWHVRNDFRMVVYGLEDEQEKHRLLDLQRKWKLTGMLEFAMSDAGPAEMMARADAVLVNGQALYEGNVLHTAADSETEVIVHQGSQRQFPTDSPLIHSTRSIRETAGCLLSILDKLANPQVPSTRKKKSPEMRLT